MIVYLFKYAIILLPNWDFSRLLSDVPFTCYKKVSRLKNYNTSLNTVVLVLILVFELIMRIYNLHVVVPSETWLK